jgi:hypothetical protein
MLMRHIVTCHLFGSLNIFHIISYTVLFLKEVIDKNLCFNFLYKFIPNISHSKKNCVKYDKKFILVFSSDLNENNFLNKFSNNTQMPNFMKILPLGQSCSIRTDRRTDERTDRQDEANNRFSQLCDRA